METSELIKKVRKIEIKTKGLSRNVFAGEYHSAFKGRGMAFSEVREYQPGDDIRTIDWKVTARLNHPYIKIFEEERELTIMLLVDVSGSKEFGTRLQLKQDLVTEVAAVLAFSAIQNNDKIGVIFFSDQIEKFIPPKKGRSHVLRIIRELIDFEPEHKATDIAGALQYFSNIIKKRATAFMISDFMDTNFEQAWRAAKNKHDLIALKVFDIRETEIPNVGLLKMKDAETGKELWVDTSSKKVREAYRKHWLKSEAYTEDLFKKTGTDYAKLRTDLSYVKPLMSLFKKREAGY
jgi:uncharacterized protein (DUF58 family)